MEQTAVTFEDWRFDGGILFLNKVEEYDGGTRIVLSEQPSQFDVLPKGDDPLVLFESVSMISIKSGGKYTGKTARDLLFDYYIR